MQQLMACGLAAAIAGIASADIVTQWNFNGASTSTVPGGPTNPTTSVGLGTASLIGGTTATFASGAASGGSSDPETTAPPNYAWNVTTFGAQGTGSGERGVQFNVSTAGFFDIMVSWDQRHSNTASRWVQFQYSLDGTTFLTAGLADDGIFDSTNGGDVWYNGRMVNLSGIAGVADNANFAFRIVAIFAPGTEGYVATNPTSTWSGSGTWRFDMVTVAGVVPAPGAVAVLGLAGLVGVGRRRR